MKKFHHMREEFHPYLVYSLGNCGMKLYIDTTIAVSLTNPLADFHLSYVPGWHGHGRPPISQARMHPKTGDFSTEVELELTPSLLPSLAVCFACRAKISEFVWEIAARWCAIFALVRTRCTNCAPSLTV